MRFLENLKIGKRLAIAFGFMLTLMIAGTLLALWSIRVINQTGDDALAKSKQETEAKELLFNLCESHKHIVLVIASTEDKERQRMKEDMLEHRTAYRDLIDRLQKESTPKEEGIFAGIKSAVATFEGIADQVTELGMAGKAAEASQLNSAKAIDAAENIEKAVDVLMKHLDEELLVADSYAESWVSTMFYTLAGGLALGLVIAAGFSWFITRSVTHPLLAASQVLERVAKGDVSTDVGGRLLDRQDEVGALSRSVQAMVNGLREMVKELVTGVHTMASASSQLNGVSSAMTTGLRDTAAKVHIAAGAAEKVSANATSVAAGVEQATANLTTVAAATEEMTATITEIAGNAEKARSVTHQAAEQADRASASVANLGDAAQVIGQVTETINAISSQTNLLALNATIEAARAGAAGKGFAVVANEIKELARQTAAATEDIKSKVSAIQASTGTAVTDINQIAGVVRQVSEIVNTIAAAIEEQSAVTKDIAANIGQASTGVKDANTRVAETTTATQSITREIGEVNRRTAEMAKGSEQTLANAAELAHLAEQLNEIVSRFKLDDSSPTTPNARATGTPAAGQTSKARTTSAGTPATHATTWASGRKISTNFVDWSDEYSVGVPAMDEHHKRLFELINQLHKAMKDGNGTEIVGGVLNDLAKYTEYHFTAEEKLMSTHKCSGLKDQQETHAKFIASVAELQKQYASGSQALSFETMNMLKDWLTNHIMKKDAPCMAECTKRHAHGRNGGVKLGTPHRQTTPAAPTAHAH